MSKVQYILTDNGSSDNTLDILNKSKLPNKLVISHPENLGFGGGHNYALQFAQGEFFMTLNNDIILTDPLWVNRFRNAFSDQLTALVGVTGAPCTLLPNGNGVKTERVDYLDGAILVGRTNLLRKFGLFSPAYELCFFEDSDISLRFQQMGYKIHRVSISHKHKRSTTVGSLDPDKKRGVVERNREIFLSRWGRCLNTKRKFVNKILIRIPSVGIGDIIAALPTVDSISIDHPTALIDVFTKHPAVFKFKDNVHRLLEEDPDHKDYDRVVDLEPNFGSDILLHKVYARCGATVPSTLVPKIVLSEEEYLFGKKILAGIKSRHKATLVCNPVNSRSGWAGRNWSVENFVDLTKLLKFEYGDSIGIVLVGTRPCPGAVVDLDMVGKTSIRRLFALMFHADIFIGIDSMPFHVAQSFSTPSIVLFGATTPQSRIVDHSLVYPIINEALPCVGCYQRKGKPIFNVCDRKDELCMFGIKPDYVFDIFTQQFGDKCLNLV
jgi:ADP-heptose:LPS heptosyltransferase